MTLYLGIGGLKHTQILHFNADTGDITPAEVVWRQRKNLHERWAGAEKLYLVLPEHPNWNICWAFLLLRGILAGQTLDSARVEVFNRFGVLVFRGLNPCEGPIERSVLAVFESLMDDIELEGRQEPAELYRAKLEAGTAFIEYCLAHADNYAALQTGQFLDSALDFATARAHVREDCLRYRHDLATGFQFAARLRHRSGRIDDVEGLYLEAPTARLFKFWSRADRDHSLAGFPLLWVKWQPEWWIISIDPALGYTLEGLSDQLNQKEVTRQPNLRQGTPRPGFDVSNPWYDERDKALPCTIVFSPRGGTRLSPKQVRGQLRKFFDVKQWRRVGRPSFLVMIRQRLTLVWVLVTLALGLIGLYEFLSHPVLDAEVDCPAMDEINLGDGKQVAIVIGVGRYDHTEAWPSLDAPVNDAVAVWSLLVEQYGFDRGSSSLLLSPRPQDAALLAKLAYKYKPATRQNIISAVENAVNDQKPTNRDSLLVYYAGHGTSDAQKTYLIPEEGGPKSAYTTWISDKDLEDPLRLNRRFRHVQVILDACKTSGFDIGNRSAHKTSLLEKSRSFLRQAKNRGAVVFWGHARTDERVHKLHNLPSRQLLTSGYKELVPDRLAGGEHSPFAHCFLLALKEQPLGSPNEMFDIRQKLNQCIDTLPASVLPLEQRTRPQNTALAGHCEGEFFLQKKSEK